MKSSFLDWRWWWWVVVVEVVVVCGCISVIKIGQEPWRPRDPRPGWACAFKQELLDWPLNLGDRGQNLEANKPKKTSQKNAACLQMSSPLGPEWVELRVRGRVTHTL